MSLLDGKMWEYAGVFCSICAYDAGDVDDIEGVAVVWRTRFTSFKASSDHRSTLRTYMVCSISLLWQRARGQPRSTASRLSGGGNSLAVDLFARLCIFDYKPHAGRRGDGPAILFDCEPPLLFDHPKPSPTKTSVPCHQTHTSAHVVAVAQHQGCRSSD
jgi:hypothetical protein